MLLNAWYPLSLRATEGRRATGVPRTVIAEPVTRRAGLRSRCRRGWERRRLLAAVAGAVGEAPGHQSACRGCAGRLRGATLPRAVWRAAAASAPAADGCRES